MYGQFYNNVKTVIFLGLLTGLILVGGGLIAGQQGVLVALVIAAVMNVSSFYFSDQIALASARAQEVGPDHPLFGIVQGLARRAGLPMPRVYISPSKPPTPSPPVAAPTTPPFAPRKASSDMLNENEIAGVLSHEMAHVLHRDILIFSVAATIAGGISYLGYLFMWGGIGYGQRSRNEGNALLGLLFLILGPVAAGLIQAAISRSREFNADSGGAQICGNPMWLATALEKIHFANSRIPMDVNPAFNSMYIAEPLNAVGSIGELFQTHPPLEARLMNLIGRPSTGQFRNAA